VLQQQPRFGAGLRYSQHSYLLLWDSTPLLYRWSAQQKVFLAHTNVCATPRLSREMLRVLRRCRGSLSDIRRWSR